MTFEEKLFKAAKLFCALGAFIVVVVFAGNILLLFFAAILLAIFLEALASVVARHVHLPYGWSMVMVCVLLGSFVAAAAWRMMPAIAEELDQLTKEIPKSVDHIKAQLQRYSWARSFLQEAAPEELQGIFRR